MGPACCADATYWGYYLCYMLRGETLPLYWINFATSWAVTQEKRFINWSNVFFGHLFLRKWDCSSLGRYLVQTRIVNLKGLKVLKWACLFFCRWNRQNRCGGLLALDSGGFQTHNFHPNIHITSRESTGLYLFAFVFAFEFVFALIFVFVNYNSMIMTQKYSKPITSSVISL